MNDLTGPSSRRHHERALASFLLGQAVLQRCVSVLAPLAIPVVPLKGIWLQHFVYERSEPRIITDVDVLVPKSRYAQARSALEQAGWQLAAQDAAECSYLAPGLPLPLDLHADLYTRAAFHTSLAGIFERATPDSQAFGCPVLLPDPLDVFSHLVGHALKGGTAWRGAGNELSDIPRLARRYALSPSAAAARLQRDGLARASRFVLPLLGANAAQDAAEFGAATLRALRPDPVGAGLAQAARGLQQLTRSDARAHTLVGFMLDSSVWRGTFALWLRLHDKRSQARVHAGP